MSVLSNAPPSSRALWHERLSQRGLSALIEPIERISSRGGPRGGDGTRFWFVEVLERGVVTTLTQVATALELGVADDLGLFVATPSTGENNVDPRSQHAGFVASNDFQQQLHGLRKVALPHPPELHEVNPSTELSEATNPAASIWSSVGR